ncbi:flagella basal body P-ring formation protein FlgA [Thermodesulfobium narugense DSM 14796]|uniref:Flagella basal body P-ring formation protein FlgA n=1 Tax=Thermodesulfobium narugense DSM 14796 TaxID=747365 RepID=M1E5W9_9BACT|nr:flagellar basal body P-ring formation chaperone FlgA [Thermodesulfobium narugense]AEE15307.1 flagella basal body P-ring formation protein FlgA [Thermodesulfobium narugense DSM 14796]
MFKFLIRFLIISLIFISLNLWCVALANNPDSLVLSAVKDSLTFQPSKIAIEPIYALPDLDYTKAMSMGAIHSGVNKFVIFYNQEGVQRFIEADYLVRIWLNVYVAKVPLKAGSVINVNDNVVKDERELSTLPKDFAIDDNINGSTLNANIAMGQVIRLGLISKRIDIRLGQRVIVVGKVGNATFSLPAVALSSGSIGDDIKVRCITNNKVFIGKIISSSEVQTGG